MLRTGQGYPKGKVNSKVSFPNELCFRVAVQNNRPPFPTVPGYGISLWLQFDRSDLKSRIIFAQVSSSHKPIKTWYQKFKMWLNIVSVWIFILKIGDMARNLRFEIRQITKRTGCSVCLKFTMLPSLPGLSSSIADKKKFITAFWEKKCCGGLV